MILADHQSTESKEQISLKGDIGLDNILELQSFLLTIDLDKKIYEINIKSAKLVDLSTLQVFVSFQNKIRQENKNASIVFTFGPDWKDLVQASGFSGLWLAETRNKKDLS